MNSFHKRIRLSALAIKRGATSLEAKKYYLVIHTSESSTTSFGFKLVASESDIDNVINSLLKSYANYWTDSITAIKLYSDSLELIAVHNQTEANKQKAFKRVEKVLLFGFRYGYNKPANVPLKTYSLNIK